MKVQPLPDRTYMVDFANGAEAHLFADHVSAFTYQGFGIANMMLRAAATPEAESISTRVTHRQLRRVARSLRHFAESGYPERRKHRIFTHVEELALYASVLSEAVANHEPVEFTYERPIIRETSIVYGSISAQSRRPLPDHPHRPLQIVQAL